MARSLAPKGPSSHSRDEKSELPAGRPSPITKTARIPLVKDPERLKTPFVSTRVRYHKLWALLARQRELEALPLHCASRMQIAGIPQPCGTPASSKPTAGPSVWPENASRERGRTIRLSANLPGLLRPKDAGLEATARGSPSSATMLEDTCGARDRHSCLYGMLVPSACGDTCASPQSCVPMEPEKAG
ncbi:hypothetical protein LY76DRAFT_292692 [Colletotrichum caudatum]|nr:hypothetical protein LY76DRAFT_292692 [Colletotrichum caudatum]